MYKKICGKYEFNDYQKLIKDVIEQAKKEYQEAYERVGILDLKELDLRHFLEDKSLNAPKINKIASKIRAVRIERREQKAKVAYLYNFIKVIDKLSKNGTLNELLDTSLLNYRDCEYKPRVLSLDDIFENKDSEESES